MTDTAEVYSDTTKKCPQCSRASAGNPKGIPIYKPLSAFYRDSSQKDGLSVQCKACKKRMQRKSYHIRKNIPTEPLPPEPEPKLELVPVQMEDGTTKMMTPQQYQEMLGPMPTL